MYLGHLITENGVQPKPNKVKAVPDYPVPRSPKDIKSFLDIAEYYRKFIKSFTSFTYPITKLLKKNTDCKWTSQQQNCFKTLKNIYVPSQYYVTQISLNHFSLPLMLPILPLDHHKENIQMTYPYPTPVEL